MPAEISVIHTDEALLVLNKPAGLLSVPGRGVDKQDCLSTRAQQHYPDALVVHRLDMATSGLLVMARGPEVQRMVNAAFAARQVQKRYQAVVDGLLTDKNGAVVDSDTWATIDLPILLDWPNRPKRIINAIGGKSSITRWRVLSTDPIEKTTRLELEPVTGRSHQLRVHLQAINHPILGDALYATEQAVAKANRLLLHATVLELPHPITQRLMRFECPPPF